MDLQRSAPESQGIASSAVLDFVEAVENNRLELHSMMLLRHGQVIAEGWWSPYTSERPHKLFSLSKSFTSTAVGLAVAEKRLRVDDTVLSFFPDEAPASVSENLQKMRVRDLLTMTTGHAQDATSGLYDRADGDWVRAFLAQPPEFAPGTHFVYNSAATFMLSATVQKITGEHLLDYLVPRLFEPLGIENPRWENSPRGIAVGGWGLSVRTEDIARFGQLYLQKGNWNGVQLLPEAWVNQATTRQVPNGDKPDSDWSEGYGYQFWRCRHNAYRGDGAFGQYCVVLPDQDAVLAITSGVGDMQAVLTLVWAHLLPALQAAPLPENTAAQEKLRQKLALLRLPLPGGEATSPLAESVSGHWYTLDENDEHLRAIVYEFDNNDGGAAVTIEDKNGAHRILCGSGQWNLQATMLGEETAQPIAAAGAWTAEDTFTVVLQYTETPFRHTIASRFDGDHVMIERSVNVAFGPKEQPTLRGARNQHATE